MSDILISVLDASAVSAFTAIAQASGFWQKQIAGPRGTTVPAHIIKQGQLSNGSSYYFNDVGAVMQPTGNTIQGPLGPYPETAPVTDGSGNLLHWARVAVNGPFDQNFANIVAVAQQQGCTVYLKWPIGANGALVWSSDGGVTQSPLTYLDNIGVMS